MEDIHTSINKTLPASLNDLQQSHVNITKIADYCRQVYASDPSDQSFAGTQGYIKDALSNVAYHIHSVGLHLTNFLQLQAKELDKLDLQIQTVSDRLKAAHDTTGQLGLKSMQVPRGYVTRPKSRKTDMERGPTRTYARQVIDLKALDNVGVDLAGNKGSDSFNLSGGGSSSYGTTRSMGPPPSMAPPTPRTSGYDAPPPPPRDLGPPSMMAPPSMDGGELPPPPPPPFA
eukprot:TRINITY_DN1567_c0_g1_i1.p1 TRINITY_DN1567_c0_g1~~TRINITY_DN1567_c0_g1_i1.p1  ORF type:complete len:230 (-),score=56.05 TRINITY_DN1567_c0_g1_i1:195-884(-)